MKITKNHCPKAKPFQYIELLAFQMIEKFKAGRLKKQEIHNEIGKFKGEEQEAFREYLNYWRVKK